MSKLINTDTTTTYNVRKDDNTPIKGYFIVKDNEKKQYVVTNVQVADISELTEQNTVTPMTKNYTDAQDMVKTLGADATLKHINSEGLTKIRSDRGKRAWAKKKALATA